MSFSAPGILIAALLCAGMVMAPYRVLQVLTERLVPRDATVQVALGGVVILFLLAFLFWIAVLWATYHMEVRHSCSGDTCIGYMLLAMPFPFVYGWAEILLFRARRASAAPAAPQRSNGR